ncbi:alpha/beta hydrolase [Amycolatopsis sp. FBCC-B4732]|uniref:alpha/beta fold hydrolase n=1 Tax=Amycolatopsis sp. FBCC-B4732 TaxID=3079339 RepID=UPI001FF424AA|nr:alpha/beta hydrolase [Amycolatopsis sp. FBCC-B4732]UOX89672.1 alpha/beta hydrolase [Amycolatopsis sp. FBCC-B4732]
MPHITVDHTRLHYEDAGSGPALLFLHGWGTSGRVWQSCLPDLVRDHRVFTLDWRGCGRSDHPAEGNTIDGIAADLAAVIETLGIKPTVVGSSIGGVFATELALGRPELVEQVVAVDSPGYWPSTGMLDKVHDLRKRLVDDRVGTLEDWVPNWVAFPAPGLVAWTIRQLLDSGVYIDALFTEVTTYDPRPRLKDLKVPITYLHGELDAEIPLEVPRACAAETGARVHVLAGCGHLPHQENPRAFTAALREII